MQSVWAGFFCAQQRVLWVPADCGELTAMPAFDLNFAVNDYSFKKKLVVIVAAIFFIKW